MTWTTIDSDFHGYSLTEMNKFVSALSERRLALGQAALSLLTATDSVPGASVINEWQTWIETNCTSFVVSHDTDGNPLSAGAYDGEASLPFYTDIADVFDHTGLAHSDWRRMRNRALFGYGKATSDDGRAIQLFQDLQAVLNVLVWTYYSTGFTSVDRLYYEGSSSFNPDAATAIAGAVADFQIESSRPAPFAISELRHTSSWHAVLARSECRFSRTGVWNGVTRDADWYLFATKPEGAYTPTPAFYAYDSVEEDKWNLFSQDEPATNATTVVSATKIGDAATAPSSPFAATNEIWGWAGASDTYWYFAPISVTAVFRWNVVDGFTYQ